MIYPGKMELVDAFTNLSIHKDEFSSLFGLYETIKFHKNRFNIDYHIYEQVKYYLEHIVLNEEYYTDDDDDDDDHFLLNLYKIDYYLSSVKKNYEEGNWIKARNHFIKVAEVMFIYIKKLKFKSY